MSKSPSKTNKSRGRDRSKDQPRGKNNKSNSGERVGDRDKPRDRGQSPRETTGRVTEEVDDDRELARLLQQIEKLQTGNNIKRVRKELFEDNRREEENYMEDQRNWLRNERDNGPRRMRRIRTGTIPPSVVTPVERADDRVRRELVKVLKQKMVKVLKQKIDEMQKKNGPRRMRRIRTCTIPPAVATPVE